MYKVFFNASSISLCTEIEISSKHNNAQVVDLKEHIQLIPLILELAQNKNPKNIVIIENNLAELWENFKKQFIQIKAAGGIVTNKDDRILVIKRFGLWDLPKGKLEKNETIEEAAVREVEEECGIANLKIQTQIDSMFHMYRSPFHTEPNNLVLKETIWFEMLYSGSETPKPQTSENIDEVRWMTKDELPEFFNNTYPNLIELMEKYLQYYSEKT